MNMSIYLTNLGKYNEGCLVGKWVKLPVSEDKLCAVLDEIGINEQYEEYFITDYETDILGMCGVISEYSSVVALNDFAKTLCNLLDSDEEKFRAVMEAENCTSISEALELIEALDDFDLLPDVDSDEELGCYYADELGCIEIPDALASYFDYEAYGRDIRMEAAVTYTSYGCVIDNR